jgi:hypothetical protein
MLLVLSGVVWCCLLLAGVVNQLQEIKILDPFEH